MRAISFGRVNVQDPGVPVRLGQSTLAANLDEAAQTLAVTSASPFCTDLIPFKLDIDPTGDHEAVMVTGIAGTTFTVRRGIDGTTPIAHGSLAVVMADFPFAGWTLESVPGLTGRVYWGRHPITAGGAGVIHDFYENVDGSLHKNSDFMPGCGNPLNLTDFATDAEVANEGIYITLWQK